MKPVMRTLLAFMFSFLLIIPAVDAASQPKSISKSKIEKMSRLSFSMYDENRTPYTVYIFATNEKRQVLKEEEHWTYNKKGDKKFTGNYQAALLKKGSQTAVVQHVNLGLDSITLPQRWTYVVKGEKAKIPDLLVVSEWGSSSHDLAQLFVIKNGSLRQLSSADKNNNKVDTEFIFNRNSGFHVLPNKQIVLKSYNNVMGKYSMAKYSLNLDTLTLQVQDSAYRDTNSWGSLPGEREFLESLKKAAAIGVIPGNSTISLGMTKKEITDIIGEPQRQYYGANQEFYVYGKSALGFNGRLSDITDESTLEAIMLDVAELNLTMDTVKFWLGKPSGFYKEKKGINSITYRAGNNRHHIDFYADPNDPEFEFIQSVKIYKL